MSGTRNLKAQREPNAAQDISARVAALDWRALATSLDAQGCAVTAPLLGADECAQLAVLYKNDTGFRSKVIMARHGFGRGEYKYFSYPLPEVISVLRTALYPALAEIANRWNAAMGIDVRYPETHADYLAKCHASGQARPPPLLLQYGPGD